MCASTCFRNGPYQTWLDYIVQGLTHSEASFLDHHVDDAEVLRGGVEDVLFRVALLELGLPDPLEVCSVSEDHIGIGDVRRLQEPFDASVGSFGDPVVDFQGHFLALKFSNSH